MARDSRRRGRASVSVRFRLLRSGMPTRPQPPGPAPAARVFLGARRPWLGRAPGVLLRRPRFAEVADPVVIGVAGKFAEAKRIAVTA
jgi:hypothetical protein